MGNEKKAVIFDLDGTIWDAHEQVARSWTRTLSRLSGEDFTLTPEAMMGVMGLSMDEIAARLLPERIGPYSRAEALKTAMEEENEYLKEHPGLFYPGIGGAIERIASHGVGVYVLSNCQSGYIEAMLLKARFAASIAGHLCYGDTGLDKAENIKRLLKDEGIAEAIYVGDTLHDEEEAHRAALAFVHAAYGFGSAVSPEGVATSPAAVYPIAKSLLGW